MQVILSLQLIAIYVLQLPLAFEQFRTVHARLLMNFGIFGLETNSESPDIAQVRTHLVLASLALTITATYKVAVDVLKHAPEKTLMEDRPMTDILRMNTSFVGGRRTGGQIAEKKVGTQRTGSYRMKFNAVNQSIDSKPSEEGSTALYDKLVKLWRSVETMVVRWTARVLAFIWVY